MHLDFGVPGVEDSDAVERSGVPRGNARSTHPGKLMFTKVTFNTYHENHFLHFSKDTILNAQIYTKPHFVLAKGVKSAGWDIHIVSR